MSLTKIQLLSNFKKTFKKDKNYVIFMSIKNSNFVCNPLKYDDQYNTKQQTNI